LAGREKAENKGKGKKPPKKPLVNTLPIYVLVIVLFVAYFVFQNSGALSIIIGSTLFFVIIILIVLEVANGIREEGIGRNILEIALAIVIVLVLWFALRFILNTSYPIDVVPSCSMLPALSRGDMIFVQGVNQTGISAPIVNVSSQQFTSSFTNSRTESLECVAYNRTGSSIQVSQIIKPGYHVGLLESNNASYSIINPAAQTGAIKYICGAVNVTYQNSTVKSEASTIGITIENTTIYGDRNNSVVVYQTIPQDLFYQEGDSYIVHRVYAVVNASGSYYVLTKGDNNPGLDVQYFNYPANVSQVQGKVIGSVPYLGYLKLILSNNFVEPTGCNYTTQNP